MGGIVGPRPSKRNLLIGEKYLAGSTFKEISAEFEVSYERVRQIIIRMGLHPRYQLPCRPPYYVAPNVMAMIALAAAAKAGA